MKNNKKQTLISKEDKTVLQILEGLSKEYDDARRMNDYLSLLTKHSLSAAARAK